MFETFGGSSVQPAMVSLNQVALSANTTFYWPNVNNNTDDVIARIMEVTPSAASLAMSMPDATLVANGTDTLLRNLGAYAFTVLDGGGNTIATVSTGASVYLYLRDNSTSDGTWAAFTFGTGTSAADAASLIGYGIKAIGSTLNQSHVAYETSSNVTISSADRAKVVVWTSGTNDCNLPTASSVGSDFFFIAKNAGSGSITFVLSGADTIDGVSSLTLSPGDSCFVFSGGASAAWYTSGLGRSVSFAFTQLVKNVAGSSNVTLTSTEAANKIIQFIGVLTGNINVYVPNTVSVYYVYNNTSGAYTLTVKTVAGTGVTVSQGTRDILECDATNVYRANDNTTSFLYLSAGSMGTPSLAAVGDTDTGGYWPGTNQFAITAGGTDAMRWNTAASAVNAIDVFPAATGSYPYLKAYGSDTNIAIGLQSKGSGGVFLEPGSGTTLTVATATATTANVFNAGVTTLNLGGAATSINIGAGGATTLTVSAATAVALNTAAITSNQTTVALLNTNATTINFAGAASVALNIGNASGTNTVLGATSFSQSVAAAAGVVLSGSASNINLGSNYISGDGTDTGLSFSGAAATFSGAVTAGANMTVPNGSAFAFGSATAYVSGNSSANTLGWYVANTKIFETTGSGTTAFSYPLTITGTLSASGAIVPAGASNNTGDWGTYTPIIDMSKGMAFARIGALDSVWSTSTYYNAGWKYANSTDKPVYIEMYNGTVDINAAAVSGTAGNAATLSNVVKIQSGAVAVTGALSATSSLSLTGAVDHGIAQGAVVYWTSDGTPTGTKRAGIQGTSSSELKFFAGSSPTNVGTWTTSILTSNSRIDVADGTLGISLGTYAGRSGGNPTNALNLFDGTAPVGTMTNGVSLYSASGELRVMDAAGNSTLLSPHDDDGLWVYDSVSPITGKHLRIDMERMMRAINDKFGWNFVHEFALENQ